MPHSGPITRFAPSPTGFLHIGGARTALFNWLFARRHGGKMLLRIEDTDRERSTDAAIREIIAGLDWLGLTWDGEIVHQFARAPRHRAVAAQLLAAGAAYRCFATPEELTAMRERARQEGRPPRYDGRWRNASTADIAKAEAQGLPAVVRLKAPQDGDTVVDDAVQGRVVFPNKDLDDLVLLRSDGTPTYMLAVVVDDHDMGVTQIIRGDDHLTNAARQTHLYRAMDWRVPSMAHIPLIHGADGAKLSKRHGALGVDAYRAMGYLPAALRNYLVRLGWSQGDQEFFSTEAMIAAFDLAQVHRSPARFDFKKLENMNGHYMRATSDAALTDALIETMPALPDRAAMAAALAGAPDKRAQLQTAMAGLKDRAKTLVELADGAEFLFAPRPLTLEPKARDLVAKGAGYLRALHMRLAGLETWSAASTESAVRAQAEADGAKLGDLAQPLRAALTGKTTSPGVFDVLAVLGRDESLARIADQTGA